jgi:hypothetical protein
VPGLNKGVVRIADDGATVENIGRGVVPIPAGAANVLERADFEIVRSGGHVLGTDAASWGDDPNCYPSAKARVEFHWDVQTGAHAISVGGVPVTFANDVNSQGVVVGRTGDTSGVGARAYVWTVQTGGMLLESLVSNLPPGVELEGAYAIGDGGHILAYTLKEGLPAGWVLLTPETSS